MIKRTLLLACMAFLVLAGGAQAQGSVTMDGITYMVNTTTQTASVIGYEGNPVDVAISATVEYGGTDYPVTAIGSSAFSWCASLQSIALPEGMQAIDASAFWACASLRSIDLPEGVQTIGFNAFSDCYALQSVTLPEGVQTIGNSAFHECTALQSIDIPQGVTVIDNDAFGYCTSLQSVTFPDGLQSIGNGAFYNCAALQSVTALAATPPAIDVKTFDENTYKHAALHVPSDAVEGYQAAEYWNQFLHIEGSLPPVSIEDVATDASPATYANGILTTESPASITVYAQNGAQVRHAAAATTLDLNGLPRGLYIICVAQGGERQVMKVVR